MRLALAFIVFAVGSPAFAAGDEPPIDVAPADATETTPLPEFPPDPSFDPNYKSMPLEAFEPMVHRVLTRPRMMPAARQAEAELKKG